MNERILDVLTEYRKFLRGPWMQDKGNLRFTLGDTWPGLHPRAQKRNSMWQTQTSVTDRNFSHIRMDTGYGSECGRGRGRRIIFCSTQWKPRVSVSSMWVAWCFPLQESVSMASLSCISIVIINDCKKHFSLNQCYRSYWQTISWICLLGDSKGVFNIIKQIQRLPLKWLANFIKRSLWLLSKDI